MHQADRGCVGQSAGSVRVGSLGSIKPAHNPKIEQEKTLQGGREKTGKIHPQEGVESPALDLSACQN